MTVIKKTDGIISLVGESINELMREEVSDRPARTPSVVLAVDLRDSLTVRFLM